MDDGHLTLRDAASRLGISTRTARRWIKAGTLPAELRSGRYGPEYVVPSAAVTHRREEHGLGKTSRLTVADLGRMITGMRAEIEALREDIRRLRDAHNRATVPQDRQR